MQAQVKGFLIPLLGQCPTPGFDAPGGHCALVDLCV